jgi:hypothetical protein
MWIGSKSAIEVDEDDERGTLVDRRFGRPPADERRNERENTARGSTSEPNRRAETLAKPSAGEDRQETVALDPAFYPKDNG